MSCHSPLSDRHVHALVVTHGARVCPGLSPAGSGSAARLLSARHPQPSGTSGKGRLFLPEWGRDLAAVLPSHDVFPSLSQNKSDTFSPHRPFHPSLRCKTSIFGPWFPPAFCSPAWGSLGRFPRFWERRSKSHGRKWRVHREGSGGRLRAGTQHGWQGWGERLLSCYWGSPSSWRTYLSFLSISIICGIPMKKREKVLVACFKEAVRLPWLPLNRAGFGPTALIHQPGKVRGGFWFVKCCTRTFVHGTRCC